MPFGFEFTPRLMVREKAIEPFSEMASHKIRLPVPVTYTCVPAGFTAMPCIEPGLAGKLSVCWIFQLAAFNVSTEVAFLM